MSRQQREIYSKCLREKDPSIGQRAGFGGTILHGLATYGFAARAIVAKVGGNDPSTLKAIAGQFTSPVKPGGTSLVLYPS